MITFLIKRIIQSLLVMLVISTIAFYISDNLGDPTRELLGNISSVEEREKLREELGLDQPFFQKYFNFIGNVLQGDFGNSYFFKQPVLEIIFEKFSATFELVVAAVFWVVLFSFPIGVYCAVFPKKILSRLFILISSLGISIPVFLTAILLIYIFPVKLGILYSYGRGEVINIFNWQSNFFTVDGILHLILPSITLASIMIPLFIRLIRAEMMEVLETDYIHYARAKGISTFRLLFVHAFKNTLIPVVSVGCVQIGTMLAYTILTESVFQWPGMGFMFLEAIKRSDIPLIISYLIFVGLIFIITSTLADIIYALVNPTIKLENK